MLGGMEQADAVIVIFGAAVRPGGRPSAMLRRRVEAAATFSGRFTAPLFLPTGGVGRHGPSEASVMRGLLVQCGMAAERILLEESGTDTLSSARAVARLLRANRLTAPVFAASSAFHLPRCLLLLRLFGVPARAAGPPWASAGSRWTTRAWWWLREAVALPYDLILVLAERRGFHSDQ
jgi:vancomycin permeability regulator SanA